MSGLGGRALVRVMVAVACCLTAAASVSAPTASAASPALNVAPETLIVASGGSDACAPCATISQAVARGSADLKAGAASAVMIIVAAGRYDENVSISTGPITISGAGAGVTLVNGGYSGSVFTVAGARR